MQLWLNIPQKLYSPRLAQVQFQNFSIIILGPFICSMQNPEVKVANIESVPKAFWQSFVPVRQLSIQRPMTGSVMAMTPPVQPQQNDWSGLAKGEAEDELCWREVVGQKEQKGRSSFLGFTMQATGSLTVQGVSPQLGLQPLHDILPTQLFFYYGQTVAWKVRPFLAEKAYVQSEQYCCTQTLDASNRLSTRNSLAFAMGYLIIISKKQQRRITTFLHSYHSTYLAADR